MPIIESSFRPPPWLRNGHVQTILGALLPRRLTLDWERERLEIPDGDFLDLDWGRRDCQRVAILSHGLEGHSRERYNTGLGSILAARDWDVLAWNFRGCSGEPNRLPRFYHSGESGDLRIVVDYAARTYRQIALAGVSLGGNVTLKYLGEAAPHPAIVAAATVSVPLDLSACVRVIDERWRNHFYLLRFLRSLSRKVETKARQFPSAIDASGVRRIASLRAFDNRYTAPLHHFAGAADYYSKSSALQFLQRITIPTLLLNARDDPFLAPDASHISIVAANPALTLENPACGGHVGFLDLQRGIEPWWETRVAAFLDCASRMRNVRLQKESMNHFRPPEASASDVSI